MSGGGIVFMTLAWTGVMGLAFWSFARILRGRRHFDPDGIGPASPPSPGDSEGR